jgi:hypothetical protein
MNPKNAPGEWFQETILQNEGENTV